ncbi:bicyclomycin/multidrug efflux system [Macrococcoides caseolyticum]|uniref:MFS transporter n=1 Tax=Macrococcoides caseolyticum TaxID=69966 RepID=UPI000DFF3C9B|nr:MFS transporter [Macrococcus caseolyticus]STY75041.1 bicyclomycin/multidrug efflux system [Macrococcus caseolyticus]
MHKIEIKKDSTYLNKNILLLLTFDFISTFGSRIFSFCCAFYILINTSNSYIYSIYLGLIVLTSIISTPISGIFIDTVNNKFLIFFSQAVSILSLFLFFFIFTDGIAKYIIIIIGIILTITDGINSVIIQSNIQNIVDEQLERALSIRQTVITATSFLAPILGGILISFISIKLIASINIITEILAIFLVQLLPLKKLNKDKTSSKSNIFITFKEGTKYLSQKKDILLFMITSILLNFLLNSLVIGVPVIAIQKLNFSSSKFGIIESSMIIAIFIISLIFSIYPIKKNIYFTFKISVLIQFIILISLGIFLNFSFSTDISFIFLILLYFTLGVSIPLNNIPYSIYLQKNVEDSFKGRIFALNQSIVQSVTPLSMVFYGIIINKNASYVFLFNGVLVLIILIIFSLVSKSYRKNN